MMRASYASLAETTAAPVLRRECDCGGSCADCAREKRLGDTAGVRLGARDDPLEREADRMADAVMAGDALQRQTVEEDEEETLQAKPDTLQREAGEDEEEETLQMKSAGTRPASSAAVPAAAAAVSGGGSPLPAGERAFFEPRFGRDLSHVRIHTDEAAAGAARGIGARAYTLRNHIVFATGQYRPGHRDGRRLVAHELTHTLQQAGGRRTIRRDGPGTMPRGGAQPATEADKREFAREAARFIEGQGDFLLTQTSRDLGDLLDLLRPAAENGLSALSGLAAEPEAEAIRRAYRSAVDGLLTQRSRPDPTAVRETPTKPQLYEEHRDRILQFALPRHRAAAGSEELISELAAPLPADATAEQRARHAAVERARRNLKVQTGQIDMQIGGLFDTRGARTTINLPANTSVRFASNVPGPLRHGLQNVAAQLTGTHLTGSMTVMLALDLSRFGGTYASYRFTQLELGAPYGTEILVEHVGDIGVEGLTDEQREAARRRFDGFGFRRTGFSQDEFDDVLIGLSRVPDGELTRLGALGFERKDASTDNPRASAQYVEETHTIEVFDNAFGGGLARAGSGEAPIPSAAASVIHEVGHALDLAAIHTARVPLRTAQQAILDEFGTGGTNYQIPAPNDPRRARYDELNRQLQAAERAERQSRALSGARVAGGRITDALPRAWQQPAFRRAAEQDGANARTGAGFPTTYPNPESYWQEYFAEAYMLYHSSPELLQRTRPHVFAFMQSQFPRTP